MEPVIRQNVDMSNPHMGEAWVYVGLDLGERIWVAGVYNLQTGNYESRRFDEGDVWQNCLNWLVELKESSGCQMHVLYEVGRQGFELARQLRELEIPTDIVAVSRFEQGRRKKQGKSDQFDAKALTYLDWTTRKFPLVWVPTREQEAARNLLMWVRSLEVSVKRCRNRSLSILARWGIRYQTRMSALQYERLLEGLPADAIGDIDHLRLKSLFREESFLRDELSKVEVICDRRLCTDNIARKLQMWRGVGDKMARMLSWYVGDWGRFANGKSFSAYCGLTSVHLRSGSSDCDTGISRAGHPLLRSALRQLTLLWLRWQPECELVLATRKRITNGKAGRLARTAMARQLAVALWNWVVHDRPIPGAQLHEEGHNE